jgi:glutathione S-transferase
LRGTIIAPGNQEQTMSDSNTHSNPGLPDITLVTLGPAFDMRNVSPFCLKLEMLLTTLDIPFTLDEQPDPRKAPKGKLPYLKIDGEILADSELITERLNEITQGKVYTGLTPQERAYGVALSRLAEDHLYWIIVASRWLDDAWWPNIVEGFFHIAPVLIRPLAANAARRQVRQTYNLQGLGRHSLAEQRGFAERDLQALQDAVSGNAAVSGEGAVSGNAADGFLFGPTPNIFDFTVAGILAGIYDNKPPTWLTELAESYPALKAYADRVQAQVGIWGRSEEHH